jgi:hypothetical protein
MACRRIVKLRRGLLLWPLFAVDDRAADLLHDEHFPQSELCDLRKVRFLESVDEGDAAGASVDVLAELGIECDRSFQER